MQTEVSFHNLAGDIRQVIWLNHSGQRVLYCTLAPGDSCYIITYLTHPWLITDAAGAGLAIYLPEVGPHQVSIGSNGGGGAPDLRVTSEALDLGEVVLFSHTLGALELATVENVGTASITIAGVDDCPDLGFRALNNDVPVVLEPGDSHVYQFEFSPRQEGVLLCQFWFRNTGVQDRVSSAIFTGVGIGPDKAVSNLKDALAALQESGVVAPGNGAALGATLNEALRQVERGQLTAAIGTLRAFINQVASLVKAGRMAEDAGGVLIESAEAAIGAMKG